MAQGRLAVIRPGIDDEEKPHATADTSAKEFISSLKALFPTGLNVILDHYLFSHIHKCLAHLLPQEKRAHSNTEGTPLLEEPLLAPTNLFTNETLREQAQALFLLDSTTGYLLWNALASAIVEHYFLPLSRSLIDRKTIERTQQLLLCLFMSPKMPTAEQLALGFSEAEYNTFKTHYWASFSKNSYLPHRARYLIATALLQPYPPLSPPNTFSGCIDLIEAGKIEEVAGLCLTPFSVSFINEIAKLAFFSDPEPLLRLKASFSSSSRNGFPNDAINGFLLNIIAWTCHDYPRRQKLARSLWVGVLNELTRAESSPFLKEVQTAIAVLLKKKPAHEKALVLYSEKYLKLLLKAESARTKDYLFNRYRRIQMASGVVLSVFGALSTGMTINYIVTYTPPVAFLKSVPHAENYSYFFCALLLSLASACSYAGWHAIGSISETRLLQNTMRFLGKTPNLFQRFFHNSRNFSVTAAATSLLIGLNLESTLYEWMGGVIGEDYPIQADIAFFLFTLANLLLIALGPWGIQLYRDGKQEKEQYLSTGCIERESTGFYHDTHSQISAKITAEFSSPSLPFREHHDSGGSDIASSFWVEETNHAVIEMVNRG